MIYKTIRQHNKEPIAPEDMRKLQDIADDYAKVKNYVYGRYGGIRSLPKLYPGYTVQNEMTECGLRTQLGLPSVFFYLAIFEALGDIKTQWAKAKAAVLQKVNQNENFTPEDKHYIRFVLKASECLESILCGMRRNIPSKLEEGYEKATENVENIEKLDNYIRKKVREIWKKLHTDKADCFAVSERAYRYGRSGGKDGIFLSTKENRKRIFIPLTDTNRYNQQIRVKLYPARNAVELLIPIEIKTNAHEDYKNEVGISLGIWQMCTTQDGHVYGEDFGTLQLGLVDYIEKGNQVYQREKQNNAGRKKYQTGKAKLEAKLHGYINMELNRMLETEKPNTIYIPKLPKPSGVGVNKKINRSMSIWQRGYIRKRLEQKCRENEIEIVEVIGKDISIECSRCGAKGKSKEDRFFCGECGYETDKKTNAAQNALQRGKGKGRLNKVYVSDE